MLLTYTALASDWTSSWDNRVRVNCHLFGQSLSTGLWPHMLVVANLARNTRQQSIVQGFSRTLMTSWWLITRHCYSCIHEAFNCKMPKQYRPRVIYLMSRPPFEVKEKLCWYKDVCASKGSWALVLIERAIYDLVLIVSLPIFYRLSLITFWERENPHEFMDSSWRILKTSRAAWSVRKKSKKKERLIIYGHPRSSACPYLADFFPLTGSCARVKSVMAALIILLLTCPWIGYVNDDMKWAAFIVSFWHHRPH